MMSGAPAVWDAVLDAAADWDGEIPGRDTVRIVVAGAPPPSRTIARVEEELGWEFNQIYGLTETAPLLTVNRRAPVRRPAEERAQKMSRAGMPALGVRLRITDDGEVMARANVVMDGYWRNPDASAEAIEDGWFHTGDGGSDGRRGLPDDLRPQEGRHHHRRGERLLDRGRGHVFCHPAVAEVAIIGVPSEKWGETIKALVVLAAARRSPRPN